MLPTLKQIMDAADFIDGPLARTPQIRWPLLCERTGADVWVKHENHLPTGAFKVRGGLVLLDHLASTEAKLRGVITATRGNHGQSVAFAAKRTGLACTVVVPRKNSVAKNRAMRAWGAEVVEHGDDFNDAAEFAQRLAGEREIYFLQSVHPLLIRGVATYWLEFFRAVAELDSVYVPIGLGSGICAAIAARDGLGLATKVVGVVAARAPAYALSYEAGHVVEHATTTAIADGVAVRKPNPDALQIILRGADRIVQVSEDEIEEAMRAYFVDTHNLAEGAGAAPLAALLQERERMCGRKVGLVLCGGNVDREVFNKVLAGSRPE